ncbi:MAG: MFS transporter [Chloroflexi bacterium]|nr:MFS transporter [Chloroflexota bacterium]
MTDGKQKTRTAAIMGGLMLGMLLSALDQTIVGTAMPRIIMNLGGMALYSWVFSAYMLTATATVPVVGKLSDLYGRRWFYVGGLGIFMLGSVLCGAAQTMEQLIVFRGLQGIGAGAVMPLTIAIIGDIVAPSERGKLQGLMGTVFAFASVVGPMAGGLIVDNWNWRWVFYVNLPVGLLSLLVMLLVLHDIKDGIDARSIDYLGVMALVPAITTMLLVTIWGGKDYAWDSLPIIGLGVVSLLLWLLFVYVEMRAKEPIIPFSLFRNSVFTVSSVAVFLTGIGMFGAIMFIPLFVQGVIGTSATDSGMVLTPMMLSFVGSSVVAGQIMSRTGKYRHIALVALGIVSFAFYLLAGMGVETSNEVAVRNVVVLGLGMGALMPLFNLAVQNAVEHRVMGIATSCIQFFRGVGATVGVTVMGALMASRVDGGMRLGLAGLPAEVTANLSMSELRAMLSPEATLARGGTVDLPQAVVEIAKAVLAGALHDVFYVGLVVAVLALGVCLFLKEIPLKRQARR